MGCLSLFSPRRMLPALFLLSMAVYPAAAQRLFWETPQVLVDSGARFPSAASGGGLVAVVWQEFVQNAAGQREVWLTASVTRDARQWRTSARFAGPFPLQERETPIFSLAVDKRGWIFVAAAAAERMTSIYASLDQGRSFRQLTSVEAVRYQLGAEPVSHFPRRAAAVRQPGNAEATSPCSIPFQATGSAGRNFNLSCATSRHRSTSCLTMQYLRAGIMSFSRAAGEGSGCSATSCSSPVRRTGGTPGPRRSPWSSTKPSTGRCSRRSGSPTRGLS